MQRGSAAYVSFGDDYDHFRRSQRTFACTFARTFFPFGEGSRDPRLGVILSGLASSLEVKGTIILKLSYLISHLNQHHLRGRADLLYLFLPWDLGTLLNTFIGH
jgi:hypothetical protein